MHTLPARTPPYFRRPGAQGGFTLVELMITVAIISIIAAIAYPNYSKYIVRASRQAAQTEVLQLSNLQEKIFLNSNVHAEPDRPVTDWGSNLTAEATRFRKR